MAEKMPRKVGQKEMLALLSLGINCRVESMSKKASRGGAGFQMLKFGGQMGDRDFSARENKMS